MDDRENRQMTTDHDLLALIEKRGYESLRAALRAVVELKLGDDKYPTDIFPELTDTDKENLKEVHRMFPNLIGRVDASACRRAFGIAECEVQEAIEKELG